jgi:hypothetical protein
MRKIDEAGADGTAHGLENQTTWNPLSNARTAERQALCAHLHKLGPRFTYEAILAVEAGHTVDDVLFDAYRFSPEYVQAALYLGAALFDDGGGQ